MTGWLCLYHGIFAPELAALHAGERAASSMAAYVIKTGLAYQSIESSGAGHMW